MIKRLIDQENYNEHPGFLGTAEANRIMREGIRDALDHHRKCGVPIPRQINGEEWFELPDGTVVREDPWAGKPYAPDGWFERFGIDEADIPRPSKQRIAERLAEKASKQNGETPDQQTH